MNRIDRLIENLFLKLNLYKLYLDAARIIRLRLRLYKIEHTYDIHHTFDITTFHVFFHKIYNVNELVRVLEYIKNTPPYIISVRKLNELGYAVRDVLVEDIRMRINTIPTDMSIRHYIENLFKYRYKPDKFKKYL